MTSPAGKPATIIQKARRKISLPWFRQGSTTPPHATLSRQHTIDTPSSFQARLLRRQPSLNQVLCPIHVIVEPISSHMTSPFHQYSEKQPLIVNLFYWLYIYVYWTFYIKINLRNRNSIVGDRIITINGLQSEAIVAHRMHLE